MRIRGAKIETMPPKSREWGENLEKRAPKLRRRRKNSENGENPRKFGAKIEKRRRNLVLY